MPRIRLIAALLSLAGACWGDVSAAPVDPSLSPVQSIYEEGHFAERYRILTDLDGDGVDDLLLSEDIRSGGTMGQNWKVYLNRSGAFKSLGSITAHLGAIAFEPDKARHAALPAERHFTRIWVYLRSSGSEGSFGYYRIGEKAVGKLQKLDLYPGDGGTDIGRAIYAATFTKSVTPFRVETSTTDPDGTIHWTAVPSP